MTNSRPAIRTSCGALAFFVGLLIADPQASLCCMDTTDLIQLSRRDVLRGTLAVGTGAWLSRHVAAASGPSLPLITKSIPSTGERLPAIGLGTDKFRLDERAAIQGEIQRMQQLGGTVIDTAAAYGDAETIHGEGLAGSRERMFVATKLTA